MSNINHFGCKALENTWKQPTVFLFTTEILTYCSLRNFVNKQEKYWMFPKKFSRLTSKTVAVRNSLESVKLLAT